MSGKFKGEHPYKFARRVLNLVSDRDTLAKFCEKE